MVLVEMQAAGSSNTEQGTVLAALHYTSGNNIDAQGNFTPGIAGFNLADVSSVEELNALPDGVMGLVWLDQHSGVNQSFINAVTPFIGNPKVFGFFLTDEPDPTGQWNTLVNAEDLMAESDWIHSNLPGARTFITMMNMGSTDDPSYANTYNWENTHIDLFGLDPYPVRSTGTLDFNVIDASVAAAVDAGISLDQIVPVYQTFGGGGWQTDTGGRYVMPTAAQAQEMFDRWDALVPNAEFDYAYSWGSQNGDVALESSQALQNIFLEHNMSDGATLVPDLVETVPPIDSTDDGTPPIVEAVDDAPPTVEAGGNAPPIVEADGGSTTDPVPSADPVPANQGFGNWQFSNWGAERGLDFSQLVESGKFSWANFLQRSDDGNFSGGENRFSAPESENAGTDSIPGEASALAHSPQFNWADLSGMKMAGLHNDHQTWHW